MAKNENIRDNEDNNEERSAEGQFGPVESKRSFLSPNSTWRDLTIGAVCLASVTVVVPLLRQNSQSVATIQQADITPTASAQPKPTQQACGLTAPDAGEDFLGRVNAFVSPPQALSSIQFTEAYLNGKISPDFITQRRVLVEPLSGTTLTQPTVLIPDGMTVQIGDTVEYTGAHRAPGLPCNYIPNLISRIITVGASQQ